MKEFKQTEVTLQGSQAVLEESVSDLRVLSDAMRIEEDEIEFHEMVVCSVSFSLTITHK